MRGIAGCWVLLVAAWSAGCSDDDQGSPGGCTPGVIQACQCADGADGSRTCDGHGQGYGACDCRPVADVTPDAAVPDASAPIDTASPDVAEVAAPEPGLEAVEVSHPEPSPDTAVAEPGPDTAVAEPEPGVEVVEVHEVDVPDCTPVPVSPCPVVFTVPATSPLRQEYVWVTGTFATWATTVEAGALPLALDEGGLTWSTVATLEAGSFEYKYLVKWPDGEQQWCVLGPASAFDCSLSAANLAGTAACGSTNPCQPR